MKINEMIAAAYEAAKEKGWHQEGKPFNIPEKLALIHSEVSEALEAYRNNEPLIWFEASGKPQGMATELADVVIRIADLCGKLNIDLEEAISTKMAYNTTRAYRHGGKVC